MICNWKQWKSHHLTLQRSTKTLLKYRLWLHFLPPNTTASVRAAFSSVCAMTAHLSLPGLVCCLYTDAANHFCFPVSAANRQSTSWLSPLPSLSCLVKGWATTTQLHIHFTHTASQWGSPPPTHPISSLLLLPLLSYFCNAWPHPSTISISTWLLKMPPVTPWTPPSSTFAPLS